MDLKVVAVVDEGLELAILTVVTDADDGHFRLLDHCDQGSDATTVSSAAAIDLVHHDHALLLVLTSEGKDSRVGTVSLDLGFALGGEVVHGLVTGECRQLALDGQLTAAV